jgi:hypothetical protein
VQGDELEGDKVGKSATKEREIEKSQVQAFRKEG